METQEQEPRGGQAVEQAVEQEPQWFVLQRDTLEVLGEFVQFHDALSLFKTTPRSEMRSRREMEQGVEQ